MALETVRKPILMLFSLLTLSHFHMSAIAALTGAQRESVYKSTYKACLASSSKAAPHLSHSEKHTWCTCYAGQVVDRVDPADIKSFSPRSGPTPKMTSAANDAIAFCKR